MSSWEEQIEDKEIMKLKEIAANPPVEEHEILGTVVVKHGRFRNRKRSNGISYEFVKKTFR